MQPEHAAQRAAAVAWCRRMQADALNHMQRAQLARCEAEIANLRRYLDSGELTPWVDPTQHNAAVIDTEGLLIGITDWMAEARLIAENIKENGSFQGESR